MRTKHPWIRGWLPAAGRGVGFAILGGAALAIQAAIVLLPEYADLRQDRYVLTCEAAAAADMETLADAQDRLIAKLPTDPVLTRRIGMIQGDLWPDNAVVGVEPDRGAPPPPYALRPPPHPRPNPPAGWLMRASRRLSNPPTRRGLWLVSAGLMLAAVFLFAPQRAYRRRRKKAPQGPA